MPEQTEQLNVVQAIAKVMADVGPVAKTVSVENKYMARGIDEIMTACNTVMAKHGVVVVPSVTDVDVSTYTAKHGTGMRLVMLTIEYKFYGPAGDYVSAVLIGEASDAADKAANKAMAVGLKYALMQVFQIPLPNSEDPDSVIPQFDVSKRESKKTFTKTLVYDPTQDDGEAPSQKQVNFRNQLIGSYKSAGGDVDKLRAAANLSDIGAGALTKKMTSVLIDRLTVEIEASKNVPSDEAAS